jgi:D-serine deaminase-like pyridoxal phosphate-dependent protein
MSTTTAFSRYEHWRQLLRDEPLPAAIVDLDAVDANVDTLLSALGDSRVTIRLASKSVRHPWLMRYILDRGGGRIRGLMTFSAFEVAFLADRGFDDFLMGYPVGRRADALELARVSAAGKRVVATVDAADQLQLLSDAAAELDTTLPVCIDVDASWRLLGGKLHFGVRRSPIRGARAAVRLARKIADTPHLELAAVLLYEAQVAGIRDVNPGSRFLDPVRQLIKRRSVPLAEARRGAVARALDQAGFSLSVVNGGGTGSIHTTAKDPVVTEVTVGSGFVCSHLFTGYEGLDLRPAAFFALAVVRHSDTDHITCGGGGYIASGVPDWDRAPVVHLPKGLEPLSFEGWGEVQTPFQLSDEAPHLFLGDPVICRHAKAGELAERFEHYLFFRGDQGGPIIAREPTYRGLGQTFM